MLSRFVCMFAILAFTGCSLRLNDQPEKQVLRVNLGGNCLGEAGIQLARFADGTAAAAELDRMWDCVDKSIAAFNAHTVGETADSHRAADIARFLSKYFLQGKEIPPGLLNEAMVLKQSLVGGRADSLTRRELTEILRLTKAGRQFTKRLRSFMPINYDTFVSRNYSKEEFEKAITEFQEASAEMGESLQKTQGSYSLDHFAVFFTELGNFLYPESKKEDLWINTMLQWSQALRPAKAIFISPPKDEIRQEDWATLYKMGPRYYSIYLRARFYSRGVDSYFFGHDLLRLESLFDESIELLSQVVAQRPNGEISSEEIDELLLGLSQAGKMPGKISFDAARAAVKLIFGKLFKAEDTNDKSYKVTKENFAQLSRTFHFATEGLRGLEALYRDKLGDQNFAGGRLKANEVADYPVEKLLEATLAKDSSSRAAVESLAKSALEINTVFPGQAKRVALPRNGKAIPLSFAHLAKIHLFRSINRLVIATYAGPKANSLSEKQINAFLEDIFPILEDKTVNLLDKKSKKDLDKRFFEASLFLPSSDGDKGLTMNEAIEFESLLFSTVFYADTVHLKMAKLCSVSLETKDEDRKNTAGFLKIKFIEITPACYREQWLKHPGEFWTAVPGLASYFQRLSSREREVFLERLENFLRKGRVNGPVNLGDSRAFVLLPYYVELLFHRFDANHDGLLENDEAEKAYPVFRPFLAEQARLKGKNDPNDHHAIYMYLLANRSLPSADKWSDALSFVWRRWVAGDKAFHADRGQVVEIFEKLLTLEKP